MDCIRLIQATLEYAETHLLEKITYEDIAKELYVSVYYLHRVFSIITGITINEYIRNRRLSLAGEELYASDIKVIDLAFKYQYDSPESFTKAFSRFHGVTPSTVRKKRKALKSYPPLIIKLKVEGGKMMDYKIEEQQEIRLLAKVQAFPNECASDVENHDIGDFWDASGETGVFDFLDKHRIETDLYGICGPISKESTHFDYGIGVKTDLEKAPEGYRLWTLKPGTWAVFDCIGTDGECISEMWIRIFKEFLPNSRYQMLDQEDFELYPSEHKNGVFCQIWIPVKG